jgi:flagellar motor switch protein FliG
MSDAGIKKTAILMLALGEAEAIEVMKHLGPREVSKLGSAMAELKGVPTEELIQVLADFRASAESVSAFSMDSDSYIRNVFEKALGDDKASTLLNRILRNKEATGIDSLRWMESTSVSELIRNEHPQIIATILVHLERYQASEILDFFPERLRNDVVLRIATLDGVQPAALRELNEVLSKLLMGNESVKKKQMGGVRTAAEILNFLSGDSEVSIMNTLKNYDAEMAQRIMDEMFVFENLIDIDVALKGAGIELREKIFKNMSVRAADMMRDDLENKGPVRLSEVEAQQKEILQIVRRLADEGQIVLSAKGEDSFV